MVLLQFVGALAKAIQVYSEDTDLCVVCGKWFNLFRFSADLMPEVGKRWAVLSLDKARLAFLDEKDLARLSHIIACPDCVSLLPAAMQLGIRDAKSFRVGERITFRAWSEHMKHWCTRGSIGVKWESIRRVAWAAQFGSMETAAFLLASVVECVPKDDKGPRVILTLSGPHIHRAKEVSACAEFLIPAVMRNRFKDVPKGEREQIAIKISEEIFNRVRPLVLMFVSGDHHQRIALEITEAVAHSLGALAHSFYEEEPGSTEGPKESGMELATIAVEGNSSGSIESKSKLNEKKAKRRAKDS